MPNVRMGFHLLLAAWHSKHTRVVFMITNAIALNATAQTAPPGRQRTFMAAPIVLKLGCTQRQFLPCMSMCCAYDER